MLDKLQEIKKSMEEDLREVVSTEKIQELKVKYLGKKGLLTQISKAMGSLAPEERPKAGQIVNEVRNHIEERLASKLTELSQMQLAKKLVVHQALHQLVAQAALAHFFRVIAHAVVGHGDGGILRCNGRDFL